VAPMYGILFPRWLLGLVALAVALVLYYFLRTRIPRWLLIPLVIVLAPVSVMVAIIGTMFLSVFLSVWLLTLYSMLSLRVYGSVGIGYAETYPTQVYLLVGAAALLIVVVIVYLIRR
jgi:hypothetical protein